MGSKRSSKSKKTNKNLKALVISVAIVFLVLVVLLNKDNYMNEVNKHQRNTILKSAFSEKISPDELNSEVYPEFTCSCCGKSIDQCTCGIAEGMKEYINTLADNKLTKDEISLEVAKKYGMASLSDDSLKYDIKKKLVENAPDNRPIININPLVHDFGDVSQSKGIVSTTFTIKNDGKKDLVIDNMKSSCHCTTASIIYEGIKGPIFGMHNNPTDWQVAVKPGKKAQLKVYYDPNAHGEFRGLVKRTLDIFSDDPVDFQKQIRIELNQVG